MSQNRALARFSVEQDDGAAGLFTRGIIDIRTINPLLVQTGENGLAGGIPADITDENRLVAIASEGSGGISPAAADLKGNAVNIGLSADLEVFKNLFSFFGLAGDDRTSALAVYCVFRDETAGEIVVVN